MNNPLISAGQLYKKIADPNLVILDCSPQSNKAGLESAFENIKIPGARFFDLKTDFSRSNTKFPNTLPTPEQFEVNCRKLGINGKSEIVIYDDLGVYSSPRAWWMFRIMGHDKVFVLNGGLPEWVKQEFPTQPGFSLNPKMGNFKSRFQERMISDFDFVKENLKKEAALVIDARSENRFNSVDPEPRKDLRRGNIPNSINIPFQQVLDNGKFKGQDQLRSVLKNLKNESRDLIFSCGSGTTACIIYLASEMILENKKSIYDGSWTEWGSFVEQEI